MGQGHKDKGTKGVYSWWYRVKKRTEEEKSGGAKEVPNASTHTNRKWHALSWLDTRKCQHTPSMRCATRQNKRNKTEIKQQC